MIYLIFVILFILLGIYFIIYSTKPKNTNILEGYINFNNSKGFKCPNILLQKGIRFFLYNSELAEVPGVNPIEFQNLEDYVEFMEWQRNQGIRCPVLYLQQSYNTQGDAMYQIRPSPTDLQGGLPTAPPTYNNINSYVSDKNVIQNTNHSVNPVNTLNKVQLSSLTQEEASKLPYSPDPMEDNWGGILFTEKLIDAGVYEDNNVSINVP